MITTGVILAAGQGTRMRSTLPKVLHPLLGRAMIFYSLEAVQKATGTKPVLVVGHGAERVKQTVGDQADYALQDPQLGTGHAMRMAEPLLRDKTDFVLVTTADMPLLSSETIEYLLQAQQSNAGPFSMLTILADDPRGFGRVIRNVDGQVQAVVEEVQANPEQLALRELNASIYCFSADWLWSSLPRIPQSPKGEYYLTDLVEIAVKEGSSVQAIPAQDKTEMVGINTRIHLSEAEAILRERINRRWMLDGVTMIDPATTYIEPGVSIGQDTVIWPNTYLQGGTVVGEDCVLGPNAIIRDTRLGNGCKVFSSVLEKAVLEDGVDIGPFGHLRRGAHLAKGVHMGNFGEVKNSYLGPGTKMGHFSYVGDTTTGPEVNIGAGTITCNYDGEKKHPTEIGAGVFIGSDTMLVAPVKVGEGARTGAGAVVTKDIPPGTLAVGVPARAIRKLEKRD
jgi:bifunctional UDP-N-acetylglucosamine pyrophosphorylase/glucosamine-1-phosphate N-acetyltransferase